MAKQAQDAPNGAPRLHQGTPLRLRQPTEYLIMYLEAMEPGCPEFPVVHNKLTLDMHYNLLLRFRDGDDGSTTHVGFGKTWYCNYAVIKTEHVSSLWR